MARQVDTKFETGFLAAVAPFTNRRIDDIGSDAGVKFSRGKGYPASVVRALFASLVPAGLTDFERRGIEVKTVRKPRVGRPYEAMSFAAFDANELTRESWEGSTLRRQLERLLLAPLFAAKKTDDLWSSTLGTPTFWSPSATQLETIAAEWEMFRSLIGGGGSLRLPPPSSTQAIHVRTHGQNARDRSYAPGVGHIPKRSFWLNQDFVRSIIE